MEAIENALNAEVKAIKAYSAIFDDVGNVAKTPARYPAKNFTNVTNVEVKKEPFDILILQSGSVDITNLNTKDKPAEHSAYFKQEVVFAAKSLFSVAVSSVEVQPSLKKVVIMNQTPRYDEPTNDPLSLKPALAQLFNNTLAESWLESPMKDRIIIGIHNLECTGGVKQARYRNLKYRKYDGVHLYGPSGRKAYSVSVLNILKTANLLDETERIIHSGQEFYKDLINFQYQKMKKYLFNSRPIHDAVNDRDIRQQKYQDNRYTVPTSNLFSHLNY